MFRKFASRLAAALSLATPKEIDGIADGLDQAIAKRSDEFNPALAAPYGKQPDQIIYDELTDDQPTTRRRPRYRQRDRNTAMSKRARAAGITPREAHEQANSKPFNLMFHPTLTGLLWRSGAMGASHRSNVVVDGIHGDKVVL